MMTEGVQHVNNRKKKLNALWLTRSLNMGFTKTKITHITQTPISKTVILDT